MKTERGQAIVLMAFAMVALIAIVGLAVDGGAVYNMRRQSQNAADAAAMAGTQLLAELINTCDGSSDVNDAKINSAVVDYTSRNGIDLSSLDSGTIDAWYVDKNETQLAMVGAGSIPNGSTGIEVTVVTTKTTVFMQFFARDLMSAAADATAMTGPITELSGGVLPIAVEDDAVEFLGSGHQFTVLDDGAYYGDTSSNVGWLNMSHVYNMDHYESDDPLTRTFVANAGASGCVFNDGAVDVGATGLVGWASGNCTYPYPIFLGDRGALNGDWIHGASGMVASSLSSICDNYPDGSQVILPVFDVYWSPNSMGESGLPTPWLVDLNKYGWVSSSNNQNYYHIVGYTAATIDGCDPGGGDKSITSHFVSVTIGEGRFAPSDGVGSGCDNLAITGVQLWE